MITKRRFLRSLAVLLAPLALATAARAGEVVRNHFDSDTAMRAPGFFDMIVLGAPAKAHWLILTDPNPPSAPNKLAQVEQKRPADSIAAALRRNYAFQDGRISTFLKRGAGHSGMVLRLADEKNFIVLLVDTISGEAVLSSWRDGKATELGRGVGAFARGWEQFSIVAAGPSLEVRFNDQKIFEAKDPKPATGKTGLATAGPGDASFDEFVIEPAS